jgi:hypothetical protein
MVSVSEVRKPRESIKIGSEVKNKVGLTLGHNVVLEKRTLGLVLGRLALPHHSELGQQLRVGFEGQPLVHTICEDELEVVRAPLTRSRSRHAKKRGTKGRIRCGDHKWAPCHAVCSHLVNGTSNEWFAYPQEGYEDNYFCSKCNASSPGISLVCVHCVEKLKQRSAAA